MSYTAGKISNYTGSDVLLDVGKLNDYLKNIDNDLKTLFMLSSPVRQFGSGEQYEYLQSQGDGTWDWSSVIGGWNITVDTLYAGTGASYIGLQPGTGIWLGDEVFLDAPFSVDPAGVLHAHSGLIDGLLKLGSIDAPYVAIDGENKQISSSDYVSGPLGAGWAITTTLAEFQNIRARGKFTSACFEKDVVSSIGGNLLVSDSDILDADMGADDSGVDLTISGDTTFAVGDVLRIKDGVDDEWFEVTNTDNAPTYVVDRDKAGDYTADNNPEWTKGTTVVNYGQSGDGLIFMTASEANAPHIDVLTHAGSPWDTTTTRLRIGNLNGFLDYSSDLYGIAIGETDKYLKYDPTNGLRIKGEITITGGNASVTFYQASEPSGEGEKDGDYWVDTDDSNALYVYDSGWQSISSGGGITTFRQSGEDTYTKLLIHFDGADGATTHTAATGQTITFEGTAQLDTAQKKFVTASLLLDGDSDYVTVPDSDDWTFGSDDFTIDFWFRINSTLNQTAVLYSQYKDGNNFSRIVYSNPGKLKFFCVVGGDIKANYTMTSAYSGIAIDTWYHVEIVRNGINLYIFINGTSQALSVNTAISTNELTDIEGNVYIGSQGGSDSFFNGWIDEFRISKGIARHTSNFTPSIAEYCLTNVPTALNAGDLWIDTDDNKLYRATAVGDDEITAGEWELQNAAIATGWAASGDTTKIDGGDIYTNTITADAINVSQLDALAVNTGSLTVDEYIESSDYSSGSAGFKLAPTTGLEINEGTIKVSVIPWVVANYCAADGVTVDPEGTADVNYNAIDEDLDTVTNTFTSTNQTDPGEEVFRIDLGEVKKIRNRICAKIGIWSVADIEGTYCRMSYSDDGSSWSSCDLDFTTSNSEDIKYLSYSVWDNDFPFINVRYIRFNIWITLIEGGEYANLKVYEVIAQ